MEINYFISLNISFDWLRMIGKLQRKYLGATIPVINVHGSINQDL